MNKTKKNKNKNKIKIKTDKKEGQYNLQRCKTLFRRSRKNIKNKIEINIFITL